MIRKLIPFALALLFARNAAAARADTSMVSIALGVTIVYNSPGGQPGTIYRSTLTVPGLPAVTGLCTVAADHSCTFLFPVVYEQFLAARCTKWTFSFWRDGGDATALQLQRLCR